MVKTLLGCAASLSRAKAVLPAAVYCSTHSSKQAVYCLHLCLAAWLYDVASRVAAVCVHSLINVLRVDLYLAPLKLTPYCKALHNRVVSHAATAIQKADAVRDGLITSCSYEAMKACIHQMRSGMLHCTYV